MRTLLGGSLLCMAALTAQADLITFNVDMKTFTNSAGLPAGFTNVTIGANFNGWSSTDWPLTNTSGSIWSGTYEVPGSPGDAGNNFKYIYNPGGNWEDGGNHFFTLTGSPQTLPLNPFYAPNLLHPIDPPVYVTNNITFQVDMRVQGQAWINGGGFIRVSGAYNGWGDGDILTNNPAAGFPTNWWYSGTFPAVTQLIPPTSGPAGALITRFKFRANGGWEEPSTINAAGNNDRFWSLTENGDKVLPLVLYSDASLCDTLDKDTTVTYVLHITNGTLTTTGHAFDKTQDGIYINGESLLGTWQTWSSLFCPQLVNNPVGSDYYEYTQVVPAGRPRNQKVKYGIDYVGAAGIDNEAPSGQDHIQWIRSTNSTYVMAPVEFGPNWAATRVQPQYGNLKVGAPSAGNVPVTWDGCACVTLQQRASLTSGSWTDLPATEGSGSTNVPNAGSQFFRLQKRPNP